MNRYKHIILIIQMLVIASLIAACGGETSSKVKCKDIVEEALETVTSTKIDSKVSYGEEAYEKNFQRLYNFTMKKVEDGTIAYASTGGYADEISIVRVKDDKDLKDAKGYLNAQIKKRKNDFQGYKPEEIKKIDNARIMVRDNYVALIICDEAAEVETAMRAAIK